MEEKILTIKVPQVDWEEKRIGSVFNTIFYIIREMEKTNGIVELDFSEHKRLNPSFLGALSIYLKTSGRKYSLKLNKSLETYFRAIHFGDHFNIDSDAKLDRKSSYIPICEVGCKNTKLFTENINKVEDLIADISGDTPNRTALLYFLTELSDNINQHANAGSAFLFAQRRDALKVIDICMADDGITIFGSYFKSKKIKPVTSPGEALELATKGLSTKNLPEQENRGYGISKTIDLSSDFFMLSGGAFCRKSQQDEKPQYYNLPKDMHWDGTIILVRMKLDEELNIYELIS